MKILYLTVMLLAAGIVLGQGPFGGGGGGIDYVPYEVNNPTNTRIRQLSIFAALFIYYLTIGLFDAPPTAAPSPTTTAAPTGPTTTTPGFG